MATASIVDRLAGAMGAAFVELSPAEQRLAVATYRLLARGAPVELGSLAEPSGWTVPALEARMAGWPGVYRDKAGRLVGLWGLAAEPVSRHEVRVDGLGVAWAWCTLDPLFIVPLLGATAAVSSPCPTTAETIELRVTPAGVTGLAPASAVMSLLVPERRVDAQVRDTFCHFVHFFVSAPAAEPWTAQHPGTFTVTVPEAAELGRRLAASGFRAVWPG